MKVNKYNRIITIFGLGLLISGCSNINPDYDIYDINWEDRSNEETEIIYFGSDNHFAYYDVSGSPVGSYDLCSSYKIKDNVITLKCSEKDIINEIKIVSVSDNTLELNFDGDIKTFNK